MPGACSTVRSHLQPRLVCRLRVRSSRARPRLGFPSSRTIAVHDWSSSAHASVGSDEASRELSRMWLSARSSSLEVLSDWRWRGSNAGLALTSAAPQGAWTSHVYPRVYGRRAERRRVRDPGQAARHDAGCDQRLRADWPQLPPRLPRASPGLRDRRSERPRRLEDDGAPARVRLAPRPATRRGGRRLGRDHRRRARGCGRSRSPNPRISPGGSSASTSSSSRRGASRSATRRKRTSTPAPAESSSRPRPTTPT